MQPVLEIKDLSVSYATRRGKVEALRRVNFSVQPDRIVGIVGESGCGKSTLILAVLRLLPPNAEITGGEIIFEGESIFAMSEARLRETRGRRAAAIFQDPMTSLNPVLTIARQMIDIQHYDPAPGREKRRRAIEILHRVGIPDPGVRIDAYPHQFSGGMRQRISIAMALLMGPTLLMADEPTTALDVTLEAQIMHLLRELKREFRGSILFVSHNLGLIAQLCDEMIVMYAGEVIERGDVRQVFHNGSHPYTRLLLACDPARIEKTTRQLPTIRGSLPDLAKMPSGCIFASRCPHAFGACTREAPSPVAIGPGHSASCLRLGNA